MLHPTCCRYGHEHAQDKPLPTPTVIGVPSNFSNDIGDMTAYEIQQYTNMRVSCNQASTHSIMHVVSTRFPTITSKPKSFITSAKVYELQNVEEVGIPM